MKKSLIQQFDYLSNDNFEAFAKENPFSANDNLKIEEIINLIDAVIEQLVNTGSKDPVKKFHNNAGKYVKELESLINEKTKIYAELNDTLNAIIKGTIIKVETYLKYAILNNDYHNIISDKEVQNKVDLLKQNGYLEFDIEKTPEFEKWSTNQLESARKKYENESDWRGANSYNEKSEEYNFIKKFIKEQNIIQIISAYKNMDMDIFYAAWDYSHHRQKWFRQNHQYNTISPTNYYHLDADTDIAKMLIYLTDVKQEDGPFKFVKGSNTMPRSIFLTYVYSAIDTIISPKFAQKDNLYGRGLFLYRKDLLMKFPTCFMGTTHFGDDLAENSPLSNHLLNNTVTFIRPKGTAVLFDGFNGIHAGGNADKGERLAVQIAFRRKRSMNAELTLTGKIKRKIKEFIS